jgi:1-acyl-sn-glycerol-3-phosphate acyltransferase
LPLTDTGFQKQKLQVNMFQNKLNPLYRIVNKYFQIHLTGLEHIERDKNYIFAMNHQSIMDIPIAFSVLVPHTNQKITLFLSHYFYAFFFPLTRPLGVLRINMNKGKSKKITRFNQGQILKGIRRLRLGSSALIYPEGSIKGGLDSIILRGETGVIRMAIRSGIPIIPIGIRGSNLAYPLALNTYNPVNFRTKHPIHINIGEPIYLDRHHEVDVKRHSEQARLVLRHLTDQLMEKLGDLSGLPKVRPVGISNP